MADDNPFFEGRRRRCEWCRRRLVRARVVRPSCPRGHPHVVCSPCRVALKVVTGRDWIFGRVCLDDVSDAERVVLALRERAAC